MRTARLYAVTLVIAATSVVRGHAADATCGTYLQAIGEDRSRFDGFISGYVTAKLDGQSNDANTDAALKAKEATAVYCRQHPNESVGAVIKKASDEMVRQAVDKPPPVGSTGGVVPDQIIQEKCERDWPTDFRMRAYCEQLQRQGLQDLSASNPRDINPNEFATVRTKCADDWPRDFRMRAYCEQQQISGIRSLQRVQ